MKKSVIKEARTTIHAYEVAVSKVTKQPGNLKTLVKNARQYGLDYNHARITENIKSFVNYVKWYYRNTNKQEGKRINYAQEYIIYGAHLFIFTMDKYKLITVIDIPKKFAKEAADIKKSVRGKKKKNKKDYLNEPLTRLEKI